MKTRLKTLTLALGAIVSCSAFAADYPMTVTDITGRSITLDHQPEYIALGTARNFPLLEIVYGKDAGKHLVAMRDDMKNSAPSMYDIYVKRYPSLAKAHNIGKIIKGQFDAEAFINMKPKPDVLIIGLDSAKKAQSTGLINKLDAAGIQVITADFRDKTIANTLNSVTTVATALGQQQRGQAFSDYYLKHLNHIKEVIAQHPDIKSKNVFLETAAGYTFESCCDTYSGGNMSDFITLLKAENIATKPLKGAHKGVMSPETIITANTDVYIMQSAGWIDKKTGEATHGIPLGYAMNNQAIADQTKLLMSRDWLKATKAFQTKDVYAVYKPFYNSPYNLVALEYFAKWIHPELFNDLNPERTFEEMNKQLGDHDVKGIFGISSFEVMAKSS